MTFHTKLQRVQKHCIICLIKYMDLLGCVVVNFVLFDNGLFDKICGKIK